MTWYVDPQMNNVREWIPSEDDCVESISDFEYSVECGLFTDYDGYGYFCDPVMKTQLYGFDVYPSMVGSPAYEQRKTQWTHINWFNR